MLECVACFKYLVTKQDTRQDEFSLTQGWVMVVEAEQAISCLHAKQGFPPPTSALPSSLIHLTYPHINCNQVYVIFQMNHTVVITVAEWNDSLFHNAISQHDINLL